MKRTKNTLPATFRHSQCTAFAVFSLVSALFCMAVTGCGGKKAEAQTEAAAENMPVNEKGEADPFGKYPEPVTVTIVQSVNPTLPIPAGESVDDNYFTRYIKENINIDIKIKWASSTSDYNEKLNLAIASNDLPDVLVVNEQQFRKLLKSDMLADLTPYYDKYAYSIMKRDIDSTGGKAIANSSKDGKMYALPWVSVEADGYNLMWIRQDWLRELGLAAPKTVAELERVAKAFVDNKMGGDNTVGILGPTVNSPIYNTFLGINNLNCLDGIFEAFQSYPGFWIKKDGNVVYGSITSETKEALSELRKMFKDGILDQELGVRKDADETWKSGKAGVLFSPWWHGYNVAPALALNPKTEWRAYAAPLAADGKWHTKLGGVGNSYCVVRKGYEHPEAAILLNNFLRAREGKFQEETKLDMGFYPGRVVIVPSDECSFAVTALRAKMNGTAIPEYNPLSYKLLDSDLASLDTCVKKPYGDLSIGNWRLENMNTGSFGRLYSLLMGMGAVNDALDAGITEKVYSATYLQTETMAKRWTYLKKKEDETFLKIIIGDEPLDAFDTFVKEWKAEGGDDITKEVAEGAK